MKVEVKLGNPLWRAVGQPLIPIDLADGATVADALEHLGVTYPGFREALVAGGSRLGIPFNFFVNRKLVKEEDLERRRLKEGDRLYILTPVVGG